jgi:hypothetical protein
MLTVTDDVLLRVAQALAAADRGSPGSSLDQSLWKTLEPDEQARYRMLARSAVEEYLTAIAEARL